jgi:drug/metabolite transporter (DMT)-like permease
MANLVFGLNIPVTKALIGSWMSPLGYTISRVLFGTLIFWIISLFAKKERVSQRDLIMIAIGGIFGLVATQLCFAMGVKYTSPVYFSLILSLTPVFVLLMSAIFLNEMIRGLKIIGLVLSITGESLIILRGRSIQQGQNDLLGMIYAAMAALSYGIFLMLTRNISLRYAPVTVVKWMFLFSSIALLPFGFRSFAGQKIFNTPAEIAPISELAFALIFSTIIAFFLMAVGLKIIKASTASIYMNLQPVVASIVGIMAGQDYFSWDKPVAAFLVISGVVLVTRDTKTTGKV